MAHYEYRCPICGIFEVTRSMGTASSIEACASCGTAAPRVYSAPNVNRTPRPLADAFTRAEKSRDEPEVVGAVPPGRQVRTSPARAPRPLALPRW